MPAANRCSVVDCTNQDATKVGAEDTGMISAYYVVPVSDDDGYEAVIILLSETPSINGNTRIGM